MVLGKSGMLLPKLELMRLCQQKVRVILKICVRLLL